MSGMTQFVVATDGDEDAISNHVWPIEKWAGCDGFKFFGQDELGCLYAAVRGGSGSYKDFPDLAFGDTGWVFGVPPDLIASLAGSDDDALLGFARDWSVRLAEIRLAKKLPDELLGLLREIRRVAAQAVAEGRPLVVWHSLAC